jgi:hypothetical protein
MSTVAKKQMVAASVEDLRQTFDNALAQIRRRGETPNPYKVPIAIRRSAPGDPVAEKRALTDAARALAQLWNISPTLVR